MIEPSRIGTAWPWPLVGRRMGTGHITNLRDVNNIFARYNATFAHALNFDETSGNAADLAESGALPLTPQSSPTQGVETGLGGHDRGAQFADNGTTRLEAASAADYDVSTGSLVLLFTARMPAISTITGGMIGKADANAHYLVYTNRSGANAHVVFQAKDQAGTIFVLETGVDHSGTNYFDGLAILDLASASKLMTVCTNLADAGTLDISARTTFASPAGKFDVGQCVGIFNSASLILSFLAIGTVPGTLIANRNEAIARWRMARPN